MKNCDLVVSAVKLANTCLHVSAHTAVLLKLTYVIMLLLMLLLLEPKNRRFVPEPDRFDVQSSEDSRRFASAMFKKKLKRPAVGVGTGAFGQHRLAQSEGGVGDAEESEQRGVDRKACRGDQPAGLLGAER